MKTPNRPPLQIGDLVTIKKRYKTGYSSEIINSYGLVVESLQKTRKVRVLYPSRSKNITFKTFLLDRVGGVKGKT